MTHLQVQTYAGSESAASRVPSANASPAAFDKKAAAASTPSPVGMASTGGKAAAGGTPAGGKAAGKPTPAAGKPTPGKGTPGMLDKAKKKAGAVASAATGLLSRRSAEKARADADAGSAAAGDPSPSAAAGGRGGSGAAGGAKRRSPVARGADAGESSDGEQSPLQLEYEDGDESSPPAHAGAAHAAARRGGGGGARGGGGAGSRADGGGASQPPKRRAPKVSSSLYKPLPPMPAYDPDWSPPKTRDEKPAWDNTPMRSRPSALRGLKPVTPEPWASDEQVERTYGTSNAPHDFHSAAAKSAAAADGVVLRLVGIRFSPHVAQVYEAYKKKRLGRQENHGSTDDREVDKTARVREKGLRHTAYMNRIDSKWGNDMAATAGRV